VAAKHRKKRTGARPLYAELAYRAVQVVQAVQSLMLRNFVHRTPDLLGNLDVHGFRIHESRS
jgi:hypothetical protein